ncbi:hypothetical protein [Streptomyces huiliensis]|uniref:hypothetical protein n=1 Tax=Streptomyces huiliensis TaxID=2876027 RepID=UPI001CBC2867|nr:hypothetical protein [Streptomyces huiliensis]MBZ4319984.1 hypothetical protein [Streptomyces huiliensis]
MRAAHLPIGVWWTALAVGVAVDLAFWLPLRPPGRARWKAGASAVTGLAALVAVGVVGGYPPQAMVPGCAALLLLWPLSAVGHRATIREWSLEPGPAGRVAAGRKTVALLAVQMTLVMLAAVGLAMWLVEDAANSV